MLRLALALLAVALVAVLVFDNGYAGPRCTAVMLLTAGATRSQVHSVTAHMRGDEQVQRVDVITAERAYALMKKKYPAIMEGVGSNAFGARLEIHLRPNVSPFGFESRYETLDLAHVDAIHLVGLHGGLCG